MSEVHLIVAEHDGVHLKHATLSAVSAANEIPGVKHGLILGTNLGEIAQQLSSHVNQVHTAEHDTLENRIAQPYAKVIADTAKSIGATHVWMAATVAGKEIAPRVAVRLDCSMASDISAVIDSKTYQRPMHAGDILGTVEIQTQTQVITVRPTEFEASQPKETGEIKSISVEPGESRVKFIGFEAVKSERPELADADVVISGGRGLKDPDGFKKIIDPLADYFNAAVGASRAVCDAGWVPNDWQVGQTGKVVAPKLYFAIGISGAIQHVAGIKGSKVIVAINKDPEAPIFQVADYGIVGDAFQVVPELLEKLKAG